jgi:hypothetical protein
MNKQVYQNCLCRQSKSGLFEHINKRGLELENWNEDRKDFKK